ncbi:hypothetical protein ACFLQN_03115 [Candidatus Aenigmatarchaeota archaeon]
MSFDYRRLPAINKKISNISPEEDIRIRITGTILQTNENSFIIDDGTGSREIIMDEIPDEIKIARVFVRVIPLETDYELRGEIIQDMKNLDINLYNKIYEG